MEWLKWIHRDSEPVARGRFGPGDEIRVWHRIVEQGKERLGQFEGIVMRVRGASHARTFTVRRITHGEGVERVFPMDSKNIARIEVLRQGKVKRSRLYYLRTAIGKTRIAAARVQEGTQTGETAAPSAAPPPNAESAADKSEGSGQASGRPADSAASPA